MFCSPFGSSCNWTIFYGLQPPSTLFAFCKLLHNCCPTPVHIFCCICKKESNFSKKLCYTLQFLSLILTLWWMQYMSLLIWFSHPLQIKTIFTNFVASILLWTFMPFFVLMYNLFNVLGLQFIYHHRIWVIFLKSFLMFFLLTPLF